MKLPTEEEFVEKMIEIKLIVEGERGKKSTKVIQK